MIVIVVDVETTVSVYFHREFDSWDRHYIGERTYPPGTRFRPTAVMRDDGGNLQLSDDGIVALVGAEFLVIDKNACHFEETNG